MITENILSSIFEQLFDTYTIRGYSSQHSLLAFSHLSSRGTLYLMFTNSPMSANTCVVILLSEAHFSNRLMGTIFPEFYLCPLFLKVLLYSKKKFLGFTLVSLRILNLCSKVFSHRALASKSTIIKFSFPYKSCTLFF